MGKLNDLYFENYNLLSQTNSIVELVLEDLLKLDLKDSDTRKRIARCCSVLSIVPDKIKKLEIVSDKLSTFNKEEVA